MTLKGTGPLVRPLAGADLSAWQELWAGYLEFYGVALSADVTETTWRRLIDPCRADMIARVAEIDGCVVGILHAIIHPNTWSAAPVCYLEDLFVASDRRGRGVGRALIAGLAEEGRRVPWFRIYWRTASDNATAQRLYERLARRSGWVTYELDLLDRSAPARGGPIAP